MVELTPPVCEASTAVVRRPNPPQLAQKAMDTTALIAPTTINTMPVVWTLNPLACAVTAKRMMAPAAIINMLTVMPMLRSSSLVLRAARYGRALPDHTWRVQPPAVRFASGGAVAALVPTRRTVQQL